MKLTKANIAALKPATKDYVEWDDALPGFGVRVQPTGRKMFCIRYRTLAGTPRKMNLGRADVMHPDEARDMAREKMVDIAKGKDPAADRRDARAGMTVLDLARQYTIYSEQRVKDSTKGLHRRLWAVIIDELGGKRVADLTNAEVIAFHTHRGAGYPVNANRCVALLKAAVNLAERRGWRPKHTNPCADVEFYPERHKERVLDKTEIPRLFAAIDAYAPPLVEPHVAAGVKVCIRLLAITGLRRNEWAHGRVAWLNLERQIYAMPDSKSGARVVHLSTAACALLRAWLGTRRVESEFLFPGRKPAKALSSIDLHWRRIKNAAGLQDVRLHDLRHTVGTMAHTEGQLSQKQIQMLLGHKSPHTSDRYIHGRNSAARTAADVAAEVIMSHAAGAQPEVLRALGGGQL